jgi:hypothetical protein
MMGSSLVEGDTGTNVGLGSRLVTGLRLSSDPGFALSLEVAVSSSSKVMALFSSATGDLESARVGLLR